jgi:alpha-1,6-mannosyltransferase
VGTGGAIADAYGRIVKINPEWRVYLLGATLCMALTICSRNFSDRGGPAFMASLGVAGVTYLMACREFFRGRGARATHAFPRRVVLFGLVLAAVWHVEFLRLPAGVDDDVHRYVWDGRLQRLGYNPYLVVPSDPAVKGLHTAETRNLNNPDLASPYPPGAQLFFRAVTAVHESTFAFKVAFVLFDFAIVCVLIDALQRSGQGTHLVLAFAWNPLLAIEVAGSGHIDIVGALLVVMSAAALLRRWRAIAAVALGLAVAVKFLPIVLVPLYWMRVRIRDAALATAVVILVYLPFLHNGHIPIGSLGTYVQNFRFNGPVFAALDKVMSPQLLTGLALLTGLVTATWIRRAVPDVRPYVFAWPMAAALFFAPAVFPWYLLWLLPFFTSASTLLLILWTVSIIPTYVQWHLRKIGRPWGALPGWIMLLEYGCLATSAAILVLQQLKRTASAQYSEGPVESSRLG